MTLLLFFALLAAAPLAAGPIYTVTNLGGLRGPVSDARAVNGSGMAVGMSTDQFGQDRPVVLGSSGAQVLPGGTGQAAGINQSGTIVGTTYGTGVARATVWTVDSNELLPTFGGESSYAFDINSSGSIVGQALTAGGEGHAYLFSNGELLDLLPETEWSSAYAVNDGNQVAGVYMKPNGRFGAFLWDADGGSRPIGPANSTSSYAFDISSSGSVAGTAIDRAGVAAAFLYQDGVSTLLAAPGAQTSYGYGINSRSQVVGHYNDELGRQRAFVWADGVMHDLNALLADSDWSLDGAYGINDLGQIVGSGTYKGVASAFRLDPIDQSPGDVAESPAAVPEPATSGLATAVLALVVIGRRRYRSLRGAA